MTAARTATVGAGAAGGLLAAYLGYAGMVGSNDLMHPPPETFRQAPSAYGLAFEPVAFESHDGLSLSGWYVPAAAKTERGLVILHGHGSNKDSAFRKYGPWLARHYNLFLYDSRAMGESEGAYSTLGYLERHDAVKAIAELRRRGSRSIGLMGESMGGAVAINAAALVPEVKAVLEEGAFDSLPDAIAPRAAARRYPLPDLVAQAVIAAASLRTGHPIAEAEPIRWVDQLSPRPVFVIHGMKDESTLPLNGEKLFARAREPKQVWWAPEAGHIDAWEVHPEEYRRRVLAFFDQAL